MGYRVVITPRAIKDLKAIVRYIAKDNPQVAKRLGDELVNSTLMLSHNPELGRVVPEMGSISIRERIHHSYRIVYRVVHAQKLIQVLRFWHASRGTPQF